MQAVITVVQFAATLLAGTPNVDTCVDTPELHQFKPNLRPPEPSQVELVVTLDRSSSMLAASKWVKATDAIVKAVKELANSQTTIPLRLAVFPSGGPASLTERLNENTNYYSLLYAPSQAALLIYPRSADSAESIRTHLQAPQNSPWPSMGTPLHAEIEHQILDARQRAIESKVHLTTYLVVVTDGKGGRYCSKQQLGPYEENLNLVERGRKASQLRGQLKPCPGSKIPGTIELRLNSESARHRVELLVYHVAEERPNSDSMSSLEQITETGGRVIDDTGFSRLTNEIVNTAHCLTLVSELSGALSGHESKANGIIDDAPGRSAVTVTRDVGRVLDDFVEVLDKIEQRQDDLMEKCSAGRDLKGQVRSMRESSTSYKDDLRRKFNQLVESDLDPVILPSVYSQGAALIPGNVVLRSRLEQSTVAVGSNGRFYCSGVAISEYAVLTAAHCLPVSEVFLGSDINQVGQSLAVDGVRRASNVDLALLFVGEPMPGPFPRIPKRLRPAPPQTSLVAVGFGTRSGRTFSQTFGKKSSFAVEPATVWGCSGSRALDYGCDPSHEMTVVHRGGRDTCLGDSGGPLLVLRQDGAGCAIELLGITSRPTLIGELECGNGGVYVRVDSLQEWINESLAAGLPESESSIARPVGEN